MTSVTYNAPGSWTCPAGVTEVDAQAWGEGGNGAASVGNTYGGGAGGGGEYAEETTLAVTPGNVYDFTIGTGGSDTNTVFPGDDVTVTAHYGGTPSGTSHGTAGSGSTNSIHENGGEGGEGKTGSNSGGGGGGGSGGGGGPGGAGGAGATGIGGGGSGGAAGSGTPPGAAGGNGGGAGAGGASIGDDGDLPGGGAGGGGETGHAGGSGAAGQIVLTYTAETNQTANLTGAGTLTAAGGAQAIASLTGTGTLTAQVSGREFASLSGVGTLSAKATMRASASLSGAGSMTAYGGASAPAAVNQWANNYGQGTTFNTQTPVLQSCVTPLDSAYSVGGGSAASTEGNWLFAIVTWTQDPSLAETHVNVADDIHSYWRQFPASNIAGKTRTSIAYTPNIARQVNNVYVAPDNEVTAINVLVVEISGLGPWDTLIGTTSNYAAATESLSMTLDTSVQAFFIGATGGDNVSSGQAFLPSGWTGLATQTQTDGTDDLCDNILTAAFLPSSASDHTVTGTSGTAENMSGFMLAVAVTGTDPVPSGHNPNWPYFIFEAAFGGGFNTAPSELTWTDISSRLWKYDETTGIQFQLGQLQATNLNLELDNNDAALSPENTSSPYYPNVTSGTPLRIRAALGTLGGVVSNRWYVIQRNAQEWPEEIEESFRRFSPATGTDIWAAMTASGPTPFRGEVYADNPYACWPCDDQPGASGVLPTYLLNAALGNKNNLNILLSPLGATLNQAYTTTGTEGAAQQQTPVAGSAAYTVGANQGWMYGDPESSPADAVSGNDITASPGAAAWQATQQYGNTGSDGWYLSCNDSSFPGLSSGITIEGWFNYAYSGTPTGWTEFSDETVYDYVYTGQPYCPLTLIEIATGSAPVAVLQMDVSGHLNLITYNGSTGTSYSIYSGSDLRSQSWFMVTMTLTTTTWEVLIDAGDLVSASGTATGMTSAWTWFLANADMGSGGGGTTSGIVHGGNVSVAHLAVYPYILPLWRIQAHYWAAVTGFGLIPAPVSVQLSQVGNAFQSINLTDSNPTAALTYSPDGTIDAGSYAVELIFSDPVVYESVLASMAAQIVSVAGSYTSGPSPFGQVTLWGIYGENSENVTSSSGVGAFVTWTGLATKFNVYNSAQVADGAEAAVTRAQSVAFTDGYGASTTNAGLGLLSEGNGSAPPSTGSTIGDAAGQRIERILGYGNVLYPGRCIDQAPNLVQAALDIGGQQASENVQNISLSDGGMLYVDNVDNLFYWQKTTLASQYSSPVWVIGPTTSQGHIPYDRDAHWVLDPQRAWNAISISPYSPTDASLPLITPSQGTEVQASQKQYGAQPYEVNSYLQSQAEMQLQANWLFSNFGQPQRRVENVKINAASYPAAWSLVLGVNIGDVVQVEDWEIGGGGNLYTYRVTEIKRVFAFGVRGEEVEASVTLTCDWEPPDYFS